MSDKFDGQPGTLAAVLAAVRATGATILNHEEDVSRAVLTLHVDSDHHSAAYAAAVAAGPMGLTVCVHSGGRKPRDTPAKSAPGPTDTVSCAHCDWRGMLDDAWTPDGGICPGCNTPFRKHTEAAAVRSILLVPAEGDPHSLLAEGFCGARPPLAQYEPGIRQWFPLPDTWFGDSPQSRCPRAVVLAWGGFELRVGVFALAEAAGPPDFATLIHGVRCLLTKGPESKGGLWALEWLATLGTPVLLDADGKEIAT